MSGGAVNGNSVSSDYHESRGGGVYVGIGTFAMSGGTVSGNSSSQDGGGVYTAGAFTMSGGEVSGNSSQVGGGVHVGETRVSGGGYVAGTFSMSGGEISGNSSSFGSGVSVYNNGTFSMSDGTISGNTAEGNGGGVYVYNGTFSMNGGSVSGNILSGADSYGREVLVSYNGTFKMSENARPERVFLYDTTRFITISGPLSGGLTVIDLGVTTGAPLANWINAPVLQLDDSYSSGVLASLKDYFTLGNATLVHSPFTETALTGYEINDEGLFISK
jgi:predicted outer membrane repeat protein